MCRQLKPLRWSLLAIFSVSATLALAADPKPRAAKPAAGKQASKETLPDDPAVAAILENKPTTPAECVRSAAILADLGRADLGKGFLKKVIEANLEKNELADLGEQLGSQVFLDLADRSTLQPEAKQVSEAVLSALNARLRDPKRITGLIQQLQDPAEHKRVRAMLGLQQAGAAAVGPLLSVLADPARSAEHVNVRATLAEMGRSARSPLGAIVRDADPKMVVEAIFTLGAMNDASLAYCMLRPYYSPRSPLKVRAAAETELKRLIGNVPSQAKAARTLSDMARAYFDRRQAVVGAADGKAELWQWDEAHRQCVAKRVSAEEAARTLTAQFASDAYAISPDDPQVRLLYLATLLETTAYRNGLDAPWDDRAAAWTEAKKLGVKPLTQAMEFAIANHHPIVAAGAARLLGEVGTAAELLADNGGPGLLVRAVQSPDRRLQMAAAEAIVRLQPSRPFCGSSYVLDALAFLSANRGVRGALVACPNLEVARDLSGRLAAAGYQPHTCFNGKDLLVQAARSSDYEVALIDMTIDRPTVATLLQQLRHDPRTASIRVGVIAGDGLFQRAEHVARSDALAMAFARPHDKKAFQWQLDQLALVEPEEFVSFEARQRQATRALDLLGDLSRSSNKLYDFRRIQDSLMIALSNPRLAAKAVAVLANVNSAQVQRALVDVASRASKPFTLRQAAAAAFRQNVQDHGVLLTTDEISQQYQRYNMSEKQDRGTQRILALILDSIEASAPTKR